MQKIEVEVLGVGRATDFTTGDLIYQIQFGKTIEVNEQNRRSIPQPMGAAPIKEQASVILTLFLNFKGAAPYLVGTKWILTVDEKGGIRLEERK